MPWRLILFLIALTIFALFAGFNINNTADISVGFHTFKSVPVFISVFFSFLLGAIVVLPFGFRRRLKKAGPVPKIKEGTKKGEIPSQKVEAASQPIDLTPDRVTIGNDAQPEDSKREENVVADVEPGKEEKGRTPPKRAGKKRNKGDS